MFKKVDLVVSPDSGSGHLAWAANHPSVIMLFSSSKASFYYPIGDKHYYLPKIQAYSPCSRDCKLELNKDKCTRQVKPADLLNLINKILNKNEVFDTKSCYDYF